MPPVGAGDCSRTCKLLAEGLEVYITNSADRKFKSVSSLTRRAQTSARGGTPWKHCIRINNALKNCRGASKIPELSAALYARFA